MLFEAIENGTKYLKLIIKSEYFDIVFKIHAKWASDFFRDPIFIKFETDKI